MRIDKNKRFMFTHQRKLLLMSVWQTLRGLVVGLGTLELGSHSSLSCLLCHNHQPMNKRNLTASFTNSDMACQEILLHLHRLLTHQHIIFCGAVLQAAYKHELYNYPSIMINPDIDIMIYSMLRNILALLHISQSSACCIQEEYNYTVYHNEPWYALTMQFMSSKICRKETAGVCGAI